MRVRRSGSRGWTGISATYVGAYVVRAQIQSYLEGRRSAGLSADPTGGRVARSIFVADDETTARRYAHREDGAHGFVADQLLEFRRQVGAFGTLLYTGHDWSDPALARRSMELTATELMPRLNR